LPLSGVAQIAVYPIKKEIKSNTASQARIQSDILLSLPFWDDFSFVDENYPVDSLWVNNTSVLVSSGQGINPPTINVATFDGLTSNGTPYSPSPTDYLDFGYRDTLESQSIKMTDVAIPFRNTVFLSFFYQWGGNGEPPDENDFLRLEFKNNLDTWDEITTLYADEAEDLSTFYFSIFRINEDKYFHDDFRFRFVSYGRKSGRYDAWHIDYVYLDEQRTEDNSFPDRSVYIPLTTNFEKYFSVPSAHFLDSETITTPSFGLSNLEGISQPMNYLLNANIKSFSEGVLLGDNVVALGDTIAPSITPYEKRIIQTEEVPDFSNFVVGSDSISIQYELVLNSGDTIRSDFGDTDFRTNDTLRFNYLLHNFYAYDDGTAEYAAGLTQPGNQLANRFDLLTDNQDTINGLYIHYPLVAELNPSTVEFFILSDNGGVPGSVLYEQLIPVSIKPNNKFIEVAFEKGVPVTGSFFIGYTEPIPGRVRIGLDKSNDTGDQLYFRTSSSISTWSVNDRVLGSLMIRPRFGPAPDVVTGLPEMPTSISLYPNPTKGEFYISDQATVLGIYTLTGHSVAFSSEMVGDQNRIELSSPNSGFYFIKYRIGSILSTAKILVQH
jgi:hypothetical protein